MNFDFSDDLKMLREQARKFLAGRCSREVVRKVFERGAGYDAELWAEIARMGWLGTAVPEAYGGSGVGYDGLCVLAEDEADDIGLYVVEWGAKGVARTRLKGIDPARNQAKIVFDGAPVERLEGARGYAVIGELIDRAAILTAFEQVGGALACLDMAKAYAMDRYAFGRPIAAFQAVKHKLADVYVAIELARSNAYYGAWAIAAGAAELPVAGAAARVAATDAFHLASKENIHTHGGIGFTWEADCHFYYRRSKLLAASIGSAPYWKDRLIAALERRNAL
jgi:alkylation response protein AidB-like acyl-CoA dehydrogenase